MKSELRLNPWLSIWVRPRQTMQALISYKVSYRLIALCSLIGFYYILQILYPMSLQGDNPLRLLLVVAVLSIPVGYILLHFSTGLIFWTGKLVKGIGTFKEVRAAVSWSYLPTVIMALIWIIFFINYSKNDVLFADYPRYIKQIDNIHLGIFVIHVIVRVWSILILLHSLREVQKFSIWIAMLNSFLGGLAFYGVICIIFYGLTFIRYML